MKRPDISEKFLNFENWTIPKLAITKSAENSVFRRALPSITASPGSHQHKKENGIFNEKGLKNYMNYVQVNWNYFMRYYIFIFTSALWIYIHPGSRFMIQRSILWTFYDQLLCKYYFTKKWQSRPVSSLLKKVWYKNCS